MRLYWLLKWICGNSIEKGRRTVRFLEGGLSAWCTISAITSFIR
jgi:hypothetical protein